MQILRSCLLVGCAVVVLSERPTVAQEAIADGYAVDTSVFTSSNKEPILRTTTVILGNRAYDVVHGAPAKLACFDFENETISLISPSLRKQTTVAFADVLQFHSKLCNLALTGGGLAGFLAEPTFIHEFDANKSTIKLSSPWVTYEARVKAAPFANVERFVAFADWSARVAGMLHPSSPPASARIDLNKAFKKQHWLPTRITRSGGPKARMYGVIHSDHEYRSELSANDLVLTQEVKKSLEEFASVSFSEFRNLRNPPQKITKK